MLYILDAVRSAIAEIRKENVDAPTHEIIHTLENMYHCTVSYDNYFGYIENIQFRTEQDKLLFLLTWR